MKKLIGCIITLFIAMFLGYFAFQILFNTLQDANMREFDLPVNLGFYSTILGLFLAYLSFVFTASFFQIMFAKNQNKNASNKFDIKTIEQG